MKALLWGGLLAATPAMVARAAPRGWLSAPLPVLLPLLRALPCTQQHSAVNAAPQRQQGMQPRLSCAWQGQGTGGHRVLDLRGGGSLLGWGSVPCLQTEGTPRPGGHRQRGAGTLSYAGEHGAGPAVGK